MKIRKFTPILLSLIILLSTSFFALAQTRGMKSIKAEDMRFHLKFLSAKEFKGRNTPSAELNIASKYIALIAEQNGLKPLMPDGSYYQEIPVEITTISPSKSHMRLITESSEQKFYFPQAFGIRIRTADPGSVSGEIVFLGYGLSAPELEWDDYEGIDLKGKFVVILDVQLPEDHILKPAENRRLLSSRTRKAQEKGAVGIVTVISSERENTLAQNGLVFDISERLSFLNLDLDRPSSARPSPPDSLPMPFYQVEVRHDAAASILGITKNELEGMFEMISQGKPLPYRESSKKTLEIAIAFDKKKDSTLNVVGYVEGKDPRLKSEYVVIGAHHDHLAQREGRIFPGADDNASGSVAMIELVQALAVERPKRSVIFVWHTAEEKGLLGAYYFLSHCPVPLEKISANLNLDMISRNDPNSIYLIGSNKLSSELDKSIHIMNDTYTHLRLDNKYEDPGHPDRFFFRSDQYPYIRCGIPAVWFFCGTTQDYHQETDIAEKADYKKMEKVTRLAYLTAMGVGNQPDLLKLDLNPEITTRGIHNKKINWREAQQDGTQERRE